MLKLHTDMCMKIPSRCVNKRVAGWVPWCRWSRSRPARRAYEARTHRTPAAPRICEPARPAAESWSRGAMCWPDTGRGIALPPACCTHTWITTEIPFRIFKRKVEFHLWKMFVVVPYHSFNPLRTRNCSNSLLCMESATSRGWRYV